MMATTDDGATPKPAPLHRSEGALLGASMPVMTTRQRLFLPPWEKFVQYKRVPFKMVLDIILVTAITALVVLENQQFAGYYRSARDNWYYLFFPADYDFTSYGPSWQVYSVADAVAAVQRGVSNFYAINDVSLDMFTYQTTPEGQLLGPQLTATIYANASSLMGNSFLFDAATETLTYQLSNTDLGPLSGSMDASKQFFFALHDMTLTYTLRNFGFGGYYRLCLVWQINVVYDFSNRGELYLTLDDDVIDTCDGSPTSLGQLLLVHFNWLQLLVLLLCVFYQVLIVRAICRNFRLIYRVRQWSKSALRQPLLHSTDRPPEISWEALTWREKLGFINGWYWLSGVANTLNGIVAFVTLMSSLMSHDPTDFGRRIIVGFGAAVRWLCLLQYIRHNRNFNTMVLILQRGVPRVVRFLIGVIPVFVAYALFGMIMFGDEVERFGSMHDSLVALFAVVNGDEIRASFMDLMPHNAVVGQLFLYSFVCLFIYVVLNTMIAIIEEAFFFTSQRSMEIMAKRTELQQDDAQGGTPTPQGPISPNNVGADETKGVDLHTNYGTAAPSTADSDHRHAQQAQGKLFSQLDSHALELLPDSRIAQLLSLADREELATIGGSQSVTL